ncbi:anti-sigma factor [Virgibacillus necropolis]|uniref:Anti-sigma-W factor RsiW n=1 Tax=Virgibacillus necropolis TaxID=163877 RepID=A0A221MH68_9BACI|nr:anti-sigma factor [Virgibacillus necropolis]ASN06939.1 hypothetical protein CFK40_18935 [Virgibacillus necropolis]
MGRECEHLLYYIANTLDDTERKKFKEHLNHCEECAKDYIQLIDTWDELQFDFEEREVPQSLKAEVLDYVFEKDNKTIDDNTMKDRMKQWGLSLKRQFTPLTTGLVLVMLIVISVLTLGSIQSNNQLVNEPSTPITILSAMNLTAADENSSNATGNAFVVKEGEARKLVIQVSDLPKLEGSKVYQVWLLENGERQNAGIFTTNESGSGILTYQLSQEQSFDKIGITMEPDQNSKQPRGEKVIGS